MKVDKILVPVDFSDSSLEGVKVAAQIASRYGSSVDLIHVIPIISYFNESLDLLEIPLDFEKDLYPKAQRIASNKLQEIAEEYIPKEHIGKLYDVVGRKVFREVTELAGEHHDLIVMSNKGGHDSDALRSNITEKIIQYSDVPVLSIASHLDVAKIDNILVPLDRTENSGRAMSLAFELAVLLKNNLTVLYVIEPYTIGMEAPDYMADSEENMYENLINNLTQYFIKHPEFKLQINRSGTAYEDYIVRTEESDADSILFKSIIKKGISADDMIIDYAENNADLVVMATHARKGLARFLLGSTTNRVAHNLNKPLLTFHPNS